MAHEELLTTVGARVRERRRDRALSRRQLSEISGVSERFLAQLEGGQGNISVRRLADVAAALEVGLAELLADPTPAARRPAVLALLGVRGAGKSTVGAALAARYGVPFIEVDHRIEQAAGLTLSEIFEMHGEAYYRRLEKEVLTRLLGGPDRTVLATGGSIVNDRDNFSMLRRRACTVWLKAEPEDHWNRVIQQGDARPMAKNPHAFAELRALLTARAPLYVTADHTVDTSGRSIAEVVTRLADAVADDLLGGARSDGSEEPGDAPRPRP
ncbi:MAG: shikimate kinase [Myxococcota bacterium]